MKFKNSILFVLIVGLSVIFLGCSKKEDKTSDIKKFNNSQVVWHNFNEGIELAKKEKKPILIDFSADWCKYCHLLDSETFSDSKIAKLLNEKFICIKIKTDKPNSQIIKYKKYPPIKPEEFFGMTGAKGLPFLLFMDENAEIITQWPGFIEAKQFAPILSYIDKRCYAKNIKYSDYLENKVDGCN